MDKKQFAESMQKLADKSEDDPEAIHIEMDNLMCKALQELGYDEGIHIFERAIKYYA